MRDIRYALLDPTGNRTVLAKTEVPPAEQPLVAKRIMEREPAAEQVGFVSAGPGGIALRMAGGEFCGNATMSAAVLFALDHGIAQGVIPVAVSCQPDPVEVRVAALPDGRMQGEVDMPRPLSIGEETFPDGVCRPVVRFRGIAHVILESPLSRADAEACAPVWCRYLDAASLGIMTLDRRAGTLLPLVYVPSADTLCWENSCASGTTAVGAYLAASAGMDTVSLRQPGGTLRVDMREEGRLLLTGTVRLLYRRTLTLA